MKQFKQSIRVVDETEIEESPAKMATKIRKKAGKKVQKFKRQRQRLTSIKDFAAREKLMRLRGKNSKKTHRVYCYDEDLLGWPYRFTKKIQKMVSDNDRDSDEQLIQFDRKRCLQSLFEAIEQRKTQMEAEPLN